MSWIKSWWTKSEPEQKDETLSTEQVIQSLKLKRMMLMSTISENTQLAKELKKKGDRNGAVQMLKRNGVSTTRLRQIEGQLANMEQYNVTLESAAMANEIASTMKNGVDETQQIMSKLDVEDIEEIVDEMEDLTVQSYDLTEALSQPSIGNAFMSADMDDQIMAQLSAWEAEEDPSSPFVVMPDVPKNVPVQQESVNKTKQNIL